MTRVVGRLRAQPAMEVTAPMPCAGHALADRSPRARGAVGRLLAMQLSMPMRRDAARVSWGLCALLATAPMRRGGEALLANLSRRAVRVCGIGLSTHRRPRRTAAGQR